MSAESDGCTTADGKSTFSFHQDVPIPTYLLALVVGKLESRCAGVYAKPARAEKPLAPRLPKITLMTRSPFRRVGRTCSDLGPRCRVWSEKELIEKCAWEFEHVRGGRGLPCWATMERFTAGPAGSATRNPRPRFLPRRSKVSSRPWRISWAPTSGSATTFSSSRPRFRALQRRCSATEREERPSMPA